VLRAPCSVLRAPCSVLRAPCSVLRAPCIKRNSRNSTIFPGCTRHSPVAAYLCYRGNGSSADIMAQNQDLVGARARIQNVREKVQLSRADVQSDSMVQELPEDMAVDARGLDSVNEYTDIGCKHMSHGMRPCKTQRAATSTPSSGGMCTRISVKRHSLPISSGVERNSLLAATTRKMIYVTSKRKNLYSQPSLCSYYDTKLFLLTQSSVPLACSHLRHSPRPRL
jgi:hypothetical protein